MSGKKTVSYDALHGEESSAAREVTEMEKIDSDAAFAIKIPRKSSIKAFFAQTHIHTCLMHFFYGAWQQAVRMAIYACLKSHHLHIKQASEWVLPAVRHAQFVPVARKWQRCWLIIRFPLGLARLMFWMRYWSTALPFRFAGAMERAKRVKLRTWELLHVECAQGFTLHRIKSLRQHQTTLDSAYQHACFDTFVLISKLSHI